MKPANAQQKHINLSKNCTCGTTTGSTNRARELVQELHLWRLHGLVHEPLSFWTIPTMMPKILGLPKIMWCGKSLAHATVEGTALCAS